MNTLNSIYCCVKSATKVRVGLVGAVMLTLCLQTSAPLPWLSIRQTEAVGTNFSPMLAESSPADVAQKMNARPMSFVANDGQDDAHVKFTSRGRGYNLFLTADEAVMTLQKSKKQSSVLRMKLLGANEAPEISGESLMPMVTNDYTGKDASTHRANIANYAKVKYSQVYPGIDAVYYGSQQQLEYDFIVAPQADPNLIKMQFTGATKLRLADNGDLLITTDGGELRHHAPVIYQNVNGDRETVKGSFVLKGNEVGFAVGNYDRSKELIIDPTLNYSTYVGGYNGDEKAYSIAVANCGGTAICDAYITGEISSTQFPDTTISTAAHDQNVFVARLSSDGTSLSYLTFFGGVGNDLGKSIKIDASGNAYVGGVMGSSFVSGVTGLVSADPGAGNDDGFIAKLNAAGALVNFTYLGSGGYDAVNAITLDASGAVYATGQTWPFVGTTAFPITTGTALDSTHNGTYDVFVTKLSSNLGTLNYSTFIGGTNMDYGQAIAVDSGLIYVTGSTQSSNFPASTTAFDNKLTGLAPVDAFYVRIDPAISGTSGLQYSTFLGGNGREYAYGIAVLSGGAQVYLTGRTHSAGAVSNVGYSPTSNGFPITANAAQTVHKGYGDVFLTRFNALGKITYSTYLGGSDYETGYGISLAGNDAIIVGETDSSDLATVDAIDGNLPGTDGFVARVTPDGLGAADVKYLTYFGGGAPDYQDGNSDSVRGVAVPPATSRAYIVGFTNSSASQSSFPVKPLANAYQTDLAGGFDAFVARIQ